MYREVRDRGQVRQRSNRVAKQGPGQAKAGSDERVNMRDEVTIYYHLVSRGCLIAPATRWCQASCGRLQLQLAALAAVSVDAVREIAAPLASVARSAKVMLRRLVSGVQDPIMALSTSCNGISRCTQVELRAVHDADVVAEIGPGREDRRVSGSPAFRTVMSLSV